MTVSRNILAFDTSGRHCSVAFLSATDAALNRNEMMASGQAERLMPMIEEVLSEAKVWYSDLAAIVVGTGPGNFTGIRIAVSAARGLALSLGVPAVGVDQFSVHGSGFFDSALATKKALVCLHGPRDGAYVQLWEKSGPSAAPRYLAHDDFELGIEEVDATAIGPKSSQFKDLMATENRWKGPGEPLLEAGIIGDRRLVSGEQVPRPAPLYVRPADAAPPSDPAPVILP